MYHMRKIIGVLFHILQLLQHQHSALITTTRSANKISIASPADLVASNYNSILLDMDGVIWRGAEEIEGSIEALNVLADSGKRLIFVTNNSGKTRQQYVNKLKLKGFYRATVDDVVTSGSVTAQYVRSLLDKEQISTRADGSDMTQPMKKNRVFMIGNPAFEEELVLAGLDVVSASPTDSAVMDEKIFASMILDDEVKAVVVGWDQGFTYRKLCLASLYLQKGCHFIVTNPDAADRVGGTDPSPSTDKSSDRDRDRDGGGDPNDKTAVRKESDGSTRLIPGVGPLCAAISNASGKEPMICGKPSAIVIRHVLGKIAASASRATSTSSISARSEVTASSMPVDDFNDDDGSSFINDDTLDLDLDSEIRRCLMVGDRLDTDIAFANIAGMDSCVVLTGCTSKTDVDDELSLSIALLTNSDTSSSTSTGGTTLIARSGSMKLPTYLADSLSSLATAFRKIE